MVEARVIKTSPEIAYRAPKTMQVSGDECIREPFKAISKIERQYVEPLSKRYSPVHRTTRPNNC